MALALEISNSLIKAIENGATNGEPTTATEMGILRLEETLDIIKAKLKNAEANSDVELLDFNCIFDLFRIANPLASESLLGQLVNLVTLDHRMNGPLLLEKFALEPNNSVAESLIVSHFRFVAQDKFAWLLDIETMGYTASEVLELVQKSVSLGAGLPEYDSDEPIDQEQIDIEGWDTEYHQPNCVHEGGVAINQLHGLVARLEGIGKDNCNHEQTRRKVLAYCGLAGVSLHQKDGKFQFGEIKFYQNSTVASVCMSEELSRTRVSISATRQTSISSAKGSVNTAQQDPSGFPYSAVSTSYTETPAPIELTDLQIKQIELLEYAITRVCKAAALLQMDEYCCNAFTLLLSRSPSDSQFRGVNMVSIAFQTMEVFRKSVLWLKTRTLKKPTHITTSDLESCSDIGKKILSIFIDSHSVSETVFELAGSDAVVDCHLHVCALASQLLGLGLVFYTQGHLGPLSSAALSHDLTAIELLGIGNYSPTIKASLHELTCLGEMLAGPVFVFQLVSARPGYTGSQTSPNSPVDFRGRGVDLIDTWGPGLFISESGAPYGCRLHAIEIGGGVIRFVGSGSTNNNPSNPVFHWSSRYDSYRDMRSLQTFSSWDEIQIGAVQINSSCPLDPEKSRKTSHHYLYNLGTGTDYWELAERQVALQAGCYTVLQVGNIYARKLGRTVKQQIIEQWSLLPNLRSLAVPWGLQISLCTGVAKRVSLRKLIEDSMFAHVETFRYENWLKLLPDARAAFQGSINLKTWMEGLSDDEKICLIAIVTYILDLLKHTGVDRKGEYLSVLWPDASSSSYGVKIQCNDKHSWPRILQDSESCATFAAVTSTCLETHNHACRNLSAPSWQDWGGTRGILSTTVCRDLTMEKATAGGPSPLRLEDGQRYWVGKVGGDHWVLVRKSKSCDEVHLIVNRNRFPKVLSQTFWKSNVLRERPDVNFDAVDVLVSDVVATC